jgi:amino-acid N-acetyltransferase
MSRFILSKPNVNDIENMQNIVKEAVEDGSILYRDNNEISTNIRSYIVAKNENKIIGFVALHIFNQTIAEIRSLVVDKDYRKKGVGAALIDRATIEAKELGISEVLVLTYQKLFFENLNFREIPKESIPESKIWADCIGCKHFPICNEVSLIKHI